MSTDLEFNCLPTMIGSMPHTDAGEACAVVAKYLPDIPAWPQLPARSNLENMYVQFSEGFPGIIVEGDKLTVEKSGKFDEELEQLYTAYGENSFTGYRVSADYAAGLYAFRDNLPKSPRVIKGQVTGPISWGLCVTDSENRGILYDELLAEAEARFLRMKAAWQEHYLKTIYRQTLIFVDEPYLTSLGSAFVAISNDQVVSLLEEVLGGISGYKGVHCCGSTDWSLLLKSSTDVLSFDTYCYTDSLTTYVQDVEAFLKRGSVIAWGIVPNDEDSFVKESPASIYDRLCEAIAPFTHGTITFKQVLRQSLLTPSCSLASMSPEAAVEALQLLGELSAKMRAKHL
jgi:methionine synthase II (cobalamin-independent)